MLEHLRAPFKKLIEPLAKALISIGLTANAVTVIGTIGTIVVAFVTGITGWLFAGHCWCWPIPWTVQSRS